MHRSPPDFEPRVFTVHRIAAVVATLAEDGVAPASSLEGSGLDEAALRAAETRVSYAQIATVFRNVVRLARDPTIALRAGAHMRLTAYGMFGYALLSSPTHAQTMDFAVKYNRTMGPVAEIGYSRSAETETFHYEVLLSSDPNDELYRFALEFTLSSHLTLCRDLYGESFGFSAVRAVYPAPAHEAAYRRLFGGTVRFGQLANEMDVDPGSKDRRPRMPDMVTHAMAREMCQQFLSELTSAAGFASVVRRKLVEQMPWRFPHIEAMADELSMNPRTLRRRLETEGTSYRELLAQVRQRLAIEYLRKTSMTTEEIASRLGYSDAANFRHAFVRWTGKTPHEYR